MVRHTLRSLWSHKRRLISTCVAVILGVAFMAGTLVLTSTVNRVFDDLFGNLGGKVDAVVRGKVLFEADFGGAQRAPLDDTLVDKVRAVDGVANAEGSIDSVLLTLLDHGGEPMGGGFGPPTIVGTWDPDPELNSYEVDQGRAPERAGEVIIDRAGARNGDFEIGDQVRIITPKGTVKLKLVGTSKFGDADSAGGSIYVGTTLAQAQELTGQAGKLTTISVRADEGVTPEQVVANLEKADLGTTIDVVTGEQAAQENASDVKDGFGFFSKLLLIFACIALFVGWFIISNTFNILVAQRTRELALLRALGAARSQVLGSVLLEAAVIGTVSAGLGLLAGVALAQLAFTGLTATGLDMPQASLVVEPTVAAGAIAAGLVLTAIAAIGPAVRATRVAPIAALRDVAVDRTGTSRVRIAGAALLLVAGSVLIAPAFRSDPSSKVIPWVGGGLALLVFAVLTAGPLIAGPIARLVGSPLPLIKGITGTLARQNAVRSPRRTSATASALIIGVALVAFITIFASSAQRSVNTAIGSGFKGDYIVLPVNQFTLSGVSPQVSRDIADIDGVQTVTAIGIAQVHLTLPIGDTPNAFMAGIDTSTFEDVFTARMAQGKLTDLTDTGIIVDAAVAKDDDLAIGDQLEVVSATNQKATLTVEALSNEPALLGQWTVSRSTIDSLSTEPADYQLGILAKPGTDVEALRQPIKDVLKAYPTMKVQDREQFTQGIVQSISSLLIMIYALLAVSIVIALIGIANTLSLSIHERTRELGLLRAVGMTRSQLRSSVRWEATIVALMGTVIGIALGIGLSYTMVRALKSQGITEFAVPVGGMVTVVVFGWVLGVLASFRPARRAAKLNVLDAIASD
ncbi:MAG: ABC transporter permease [Acidimicrobiales bacterium]